MHQSPRHFKPCACKGPILLAFFIAFSLASTLSAQAYEPSAIKEYLSLKGTVYMLTIFVDTALEQFEGDEVNYYFEELLGSQDWLRREASYWGQNVSFDNEFFTMDNKSTVFLPNVPRGRNPTRTLEQILAKRGYSGISEFLDRSGFNLDQQKLKIVLFVKSRDRSHAYNYWSAKDLDLAVIYCSSAPGMLTDQYVVSHEILHQFGAWDLYHEYGKSQTIASGRLAKERYPNSIMINTYKDQELLQVDEVTAWRIGWSDWSEEFDQFNSRKNRQQILKEYEEAKSSSRSKRSKEK